MDRNARRAVVPLILAVLAALPVQAQTYDVTKFGLGGNTQRPSIAGLNARGQIAGSGRATSGAYQAFFASSAGVVDIGDMGAQHSEAIGMPPESR